MELYNLFSVPVLRYPANESYDDIQCEIQEAIKKIKDTDDKSCKSFNLKPFSVISKSILWLANIKYLILFKLNLRQY